GRLHLEQRPRDTDERPDPWLRLKVTSSILDVDHLVITYQDKSSLADGKSLPSETLEGLLRRVTTWHGEHNVYPNGRSSDGQQLFSFASGASVVERDWLHGPKDLAAWSK